MRFKYKNLMSMIFVMGLITVLPFSAAGQVTNARVSGEVLDEEGNGLVGANILMVHQPTGTRYGTTTNEGGNYNFGNVRVGGPYVIEVSYVGYRSERETGFQLDLGENRSFEFQLEAKTEELGEVTVTAEDGLFNEDQQGISTTIGTEEVESAPTIDRSIADFARLTPQAIVGNNDDDGSSISIAGQNNRYNSIFIDGAVANDVFGLSATGTDGGQTGASVISMDAVEQFNIEISPYDVTQSYFGGGAINAVTRSGTNEFKGSFAYEYRDETVTQNLPDGSFPEFTNKRYVGRLGGPIVEDKLFFFANFDINREISPQPFEGGFEDFQGQTINDQQSIDEFLSFVDKTLGDRYDPGSFRGQATTLDSDKFLGKLDWNINQNHHMMARYSYSKSTNVDAFGGNPTGIAFSSRNEVFPNKTHLFATELNSSFGNRFANSFTVSYKKVTDDRNTNLNKPFPTVDIEDGPATIELGGEPFSTVNFLEQEVVTVTNDFDVFLGDHTLTVGTHNEYYDLTNKFVPFNYGWYFFEDVSGSGLVNDGDGTAVDEFVQSVCAATGAEGGEGIYDCSRYPNRPSYSNFLRGFSLQDDNPSTSKFEETIGDATNAQGAFSALNTSLYVQDEWDATEDLTVTAGLRLDVPMYLDDPQYANASNSLVSEERADEVNPRKTTIPQIEEYYSMNGATPGETPDNNLHWSPRLGFNLDLSGDRNFQVRGGTGVFTSRQPFVWPGGMYLNNGVNTGVVSDFTTFLPEQFRNRPEFKPNPSEASAPDQLGRSPSEVIPSGRLELFEEDYMNPRFWRTSLAVDRELAWGVNASVEGQYTNTLQNITVTNVNLKPANARLEGPDNRRVWNYEDGNLIDGRYSAVHRVGNTSKGYSYDVTGELSRQTELDGKSYLRTSVSYTYGDSYSVNDGLSSQINSVWSGMENVNGLNNIGLARSDFSIGHRVLARVGYQQQFLENFVGTVSLVYDGTSGRPFSYVIGNSGAMMGDAPDEDRALLYVAETGSNLSFAPAEIPVGSDKKVTVTPEQQAEAFNRFVSSSDYLSERRGQYTERNGDRTPFEGVIDLHTSVEVFHDALGRQQSLEITADVFNFSSLLGDAFGTDWGTRYINFNSAQPTSFAGFKDPDGDGEPTPTYTAGRIIDNVSDTDGDGVAESVSTFDEEDLFTERRTGSTYSSQWQMKFGIRYNF